MNINLGKTCGSGGIDCAPSESKTSEPEVYYPTVYIDAPEGKSLADLPDAGTITFRFKKTRSTVETNREDETRESASLDLLEIIDTTAESEKKVDDREDALDKLAKEEEDGESADEDDEGAGENE